MLTIDQILKVGRMMHQCGEGPMHTEGPLPSPVLRQSQSRISHTSDAIQVRLVHVLTENGDVGIQNVSDDEYARLKIEGRIVD